MKLHVGQTVFVKSLEYRAGRTPTITETTVTKIGKKYFEVADCHGRFFIDGMCQDGRGYVPNYVAYTSLQEIEDEQERNRLRDEIRRWFGIYGDNSLSLDQLRRIHEIIQEKK